MSYRVVGTVQFPDDVMHARIEVCTWSQQAEGIKGGVVYLSKFRSGQIGERSVGMSAEVARQAAVLLTHAAEQIEANQGNRK